MSLKYNGNLIPFAKDLRKNATPQEKHLWYDFLATYYVRFQRQKVIGDFIVDFYCHTAKLAIEIDGSHHFSDDGKDYDKYRTEILLSYGVRVIRFSNAEVDTNFEGVCRYIDCAVRNSLSQLR